MTDSAPDLILVIDTSTTRGLVALVSVQGEEATLVAEEAFVTKRSHNSRIFEPLGALIAKAQGRSISTILVGTGPGSYTGVRIGIAAANGLAVSLDAKVHGIPSVLGLSPDNANFIAIGDARRGMAYRWKMSEGVPIDTPVIVPLAELEQIVAANKMPAITLEHQDFGESVTNAAPDATLLTRRFLANRSAFCTPSSVEPVYLAAPFVTTPGKKT